MVRLLGKLFHCFNLYLVFIFCLKCFSFFHQYGEVREVLVSSLKKGSGMIEFQTKSAAVRYKDFVFLISAEEVNTKCNVM